MQGEKEHKSAGKFSGPASSSSAEVQEGSSNDSARLNSQASTATTARTNIKTTTAPSSTTSSSSALSDYQNTDRDQNKEKSQNEKEESNDNKTPNSLLFSTLLGKGITSWPYNEQTLADALKLKLEQEKTKQEFYRLETMKKSLEVLKGALHAGVPGSLIPHLFNIPINDQEREVVQQQLQELGSKTGPSSIPKETFVHPLQQTPLTNRHRLNAPPADQPLQFSSSTQLPPGPHLVPNMPLQQPQLQQPFIYNHQRNATISTVQDPSVQQRFAQQQQQNAGRQPLSQDPYNTNPNPMSSFRFGGGSSVSTSSPQPSPVASPVRQPISTSLPQRHQLSPAKLGAHVVSMLGASEKTKNQQLPINQFKRNMGHQRHSSLPPKVAIPETDTVSFQTPTRQQQQHKQQQQQQQQQPQFQSQQSAYSRSRQKQSDKRPPPPPPSQESMTSQHHLIQFHHWQPNEGSSSSLPTSTSIGSQLSQKRRRSNPDSDSNLTKTPSINREGQSSFVNETPKSISHRRTQSELIIPSSPKFQKVDPNSNTVTANSLSFSRENDSANTSILKSPSATPTPAKTRSSIRRSTPSFLNKILGPNQD